jgi:hypothetical protein
MTGEQLNPAAGKDAKPTLGQAGSVLSSAISEFLARAVEAVGRQAGARLIDALTPVPSDASRSVALDSLVEGYRQLLGDIADRLPAIARYIVGQLPSGETASGDRLLFRVDLKGQVSADDVKRIFARDRAADDLPFFLHTTQSSVDRLKLEIERALNEPIEGQRLGTLLKTLPGHLEGFRKRDPAKLLERLKYEYRRRGPSALPDIRSSLAWLTRRDVDHSFAVIDALQHAMGERIVCKILEKRALERYADAVRGTADKKADEYIKTILGCFEAAGITHSDRVSILFSNKEGLILDHGKDRIYEVHYAGTLYDVYGPPADSRYSVPFGNCARPLLMPLRVMDASQGFAFWSVERRVVQERLDALRIPLEAWDLGRGKTPVALYMLDHREGDLETYSEIALGCFGSPTDHPLAVGMFALGELPVSTSFARDAGQQIWGYDKTTRRIEVRYSDSSATCELSTKPSATAPILTFTLPRGGQMSSAPAAVTAPLPVLSYTMRSAHPWFPRSLHRTVISRTGYGECIASGGAGVSLKVSGEGWGNALCQELRTLGIVDERGEMVRTPLLNIWTERVTSELGAPALVVGSPAPD